MSKLSILSLLFTFIPSLLIAQLRINEVMQSNLTLIDDFNDFPPSWIEIYNESSNPISLHHYSIESDNTIYTIKKDTTIAPHDFILLYGDEFDSKLHTNFKLEFDKKSILRLFSSRGVLIDTLLIPPMQQKGVSYGRNNDGEEGWLLKDTPGKTNSAISYTFLPTPTLSVASGFHQKPFSVRLSEPNSSNSVTYYTTNGSLPTTKDSIFVDSLVIDSTQIIRLRTFSTDCIPSEVSSYSYIFPSHEITLPVISIIADPDHLYDDQKGIYVPGTYDEDDYNYNYDWHRPIHINYLDTTGTLQIDQPAEVRIAGATSRKLPQKSLIIYSKKRLSGSDFNYPFWREKPHIKQTHSFLIRNAGNDFLMGHIRDAAAQSYIGKTVKDIDYQAYEPVIVYINGNYTGLMNLRERTNIDYIHSNHPNVKEDVDVIENWSIINSGNGYAASLLYKIMEREDVSYEDLESLIDIDEFLNYFIAEAYFGNADFPDNNIVMWKEQKKDAKWRWILKDLDISMDYRTVKDGKTFLYSINFFEQILSLSPNNDDFEKMEFPTKLMRLLVNMKPFQERLIDQFSVNMGDFLHPRYIIHHMDSLMQRIEYEFPFTEERYASYTGNDFTDWYQERDLIRNYASKRNWLNSASMGNYFHLGNMFHLTINDPFASDLPYEFTFNDISMKHTSFEGYYYNGRTINLRTHEKEGAPAIKGWRIEKKIKDVTLYEYVTGDSLSLHIPEHSIVDYIAIFSLDSIGEYPQPTNQPSCYNIEGGILLTQLNDQTTISVADLSGKTLFHQKGFEQGELMIHLPKGCYLLNDGVSWKKIIVTK
ncbi:MAG: CotH kinase family protein [Paludibacteraceae bacterium]|nr:CotH kinase family protein [Paludibacteraceae bacterium]